MARTYRPVDREQEFLLPPSMLDWLPEEHLVWFVIAAVQRLDTTRFHARARLGGVGRRGYHPDMLLTLLVYAMAHGESSSRRIERLCHTDVAFRVICAGDAPDHTVLARFRQHHGQALTDLLTETLVLAVELGMVSLGVVAFDGTRIAADASVDANRTETHLRRLATEFVDTVTANDQAEDTLFGEDNRGDQLPEQVRDRSHRGARIGQALEEIQQRRQATERARQQDAERGRAYEQAMATGPVPPKGGVPKSADPVVVAKARWERRRAAAQARYTRLLALAKQRRRGAPPPVPPDQLAAVRKARAAYDAALAPAEAEAQAQAQPDAQAPAGTAAAATDQPATSQQDKLTANLTDPQSRLLKTRNGWIQGYNCQTTISEDQFILTARATQDSSDVEQFVPTLDQLTDTTARLATRTGTELRVGTMIGDAGYDSDANLQADGPDRLIADAKRHKLDRRAATDPATGDPPHDATAREKMTHRLRTPEGQALYKRRAPLVEAPNAWLKDGRGLRRFSRRGLTAAQAELSFACAVTNLCRLAAKGITTTTLRQTR
ncbi:MAG TPA: transposase [Actinomycetota bacterium]|nr:transposase [Actinomycetota bacterium]